jgi:hypothetical protein
MVPIITLLTVLVISVLITRVATMAMVHTGLSKESALFQSRSAFTGVGFTTLGAPKGGVVIQDGDELLLYGRVEELDELDSRRGGRTGDREHAQAVKRQRETLDQEYKEDEDARSRSSESETDHG